VLQPTNVYAACRGGEAGSGITVKAVEYDNVDDGFGALDENFDAVHGVRDELETR
jgi:hypothetical protein